MDGMTASARSIFALPNEILLDIFNTFPTRTLLNWTTVCRSFHSLVIRILQRRLQFAAGLDGHTLYLECGPPALRYSMSKVLCVSLGTNGLDEITTVMNDNEANIGQIQRMGKLYSRFKPQRREADVRAIPRPNRPGDIPGSRTYVSPDQTVPAEWRAEDRVTQTVSVDSHFLFTQLETVAYLDKRETVRGLPRSLQTVCEGIIRVWRDWLSRQCEQKRWTDGEPIEIHRDAPMPSEMQDKGGGVGVCSGIEPPQDPMILWTNNGHCNVGIRFRVKEQKWRRDNPVIFSSEVEVPVSYIVEFDELLIRTTHLLLKIEDAQRQNSNTTGKAIVFGSYLGTA